MQKTTIIRLCSSTKLIKHEDHTGSIYHRCWPLRSEELAYSLSSSGESERLWTLQLRWWFKGRAAFAKIQDKLGGEEFEARAHPVSSSSLSGAGNGSVGNGSALGGGITSMERFLWQSVLQLISDSIGPRNYEKLFWPCILQITSMHVSAKPSQISQSLAR